MLWYIMIFYLGEYIARFKNNLESYDEELSNDIKIQLAKAEKMRQSMEKESVNKNNEVEK